MFIKVYRHAIESKNKASFWTFYGQDVKSYFNPLKRHSLDQIMKNIYSMSVL